jgi:N-acetylglucosaminyldiphosphoundecaprenol N-acetyl-beta-D-mannosaminyltransferase
MNTVDIARLKISNITKAELLTKLKERVYNNQKTFIITPYSEFLYQTFQDPSILEILNKADFAVADGIGIFWTKKYLEIKLTAKSYLGKILQAFWQIIYSLAAILFYPKFIKSALPEKIVGADLVWDLAKLANENNLKLYLLGGFENTPKLVKDIFISKYPNIQICGYSTKNPTDLSIVNDINKSKADILLVAYGPITQEKWIAENLVNLNIKIAIGVGGSFDYIAGIKQAPPKFVRYSGLEWLWRLFTQPARIKRIYQATFGLISGLWHFKVLSTFPYRLNVVAIILNQENKVLVCQRNPTDSNLDIITNRKTLQYQNYWQFPQGGIDNNETIEQAAMREAMEETGLKNLKLLKIADQTNSYIWNNANRKFLDNKLHKNIGQKQHIVFFKHLGKDTEVKVDNWEFINYKWIAKAEISNTIHTERAKLTEIVINNLP